jgi:undecaprenyl-diphosphatase
VRPAADLDPHRGSEHRFLPPLPALTRRLFGIVALSVAFVAMTVAISAGIFHALDVQVAQATHSVWRESLHGMFQLIAELGGFEVTTALMIALFFYLWRGGFGADALVVVAFVGAEGLEILYKYLFYHPGPPLSLAHADGPSITTIVEKAGAVGNSFPSGHMVRTVLVYGLFAFVVRRLASSPAARLFAIPVATGMVILVGFDRLYLDVHWESDVIGGILLGAIALLAATVWLDRPRKADN